MDFLFNKWFILGMFTGGFVLLSKYQKSAKVIVAVTTITMLFTACGSSQSQTTESNIPSTETVSEFALIEIPVQTKEFSSVHYYFYRDPVTDVVFMIFNGYGSGCTWLPDPDTGLPLKYERFLELYAEYIPTEELQGENASE